MFLWFYDFWRTSFFIVSGIDINLKRIAFFHIRYQKLNIVWISCVNFLLESLWMWIINKTIGLEQPYHIFSNFVGNRPLVYSLTLHTSCIRHHWHTVSVWCLFMHILNGTFSTRWSSVRPMSRTSNRPDWRDSTPWEVATRTSTVGVACAIPRRTEVDTTARRLIP